MIIRKAKNSDVIELSVFATKAFYDAYEWYNSAENMKNYVDGYFSEKQLLQEFSDTESVYLVAEENKKIIGYAKIGKVNNQPLLEGESHSEIERIYVDSSLQRKGIGKELLREIINFAKQRGNESIWLGVWQKNEKAINFYKKIGFEIIGITQFILGDDVQDDFIMKLNLNKMV